MEVEKEKDNHKLGSEESHEAWKEALESFKEQALKIQSVSQEAYEIYSKKALIILKETSEDLKIQADKAGRDLSAITKELSEEGKEYLSTAAENSPEVKEIVETFTISNDDLSDVSKIHDFRVGIPYGMCIDYHTVCLDKLVVYIFFDATTYFDLFICYLKKLYKIVI